jgi:Predicted metal-binding, possibly nucleic acid-binding protein
MRIELENLEDGTGSFAHTYQPEELNLVDERVRVTEPISVNGRVTKSGSEVDVSGRVETRVNVECDRCLKTLEMPVSAGFKLQYITGQDYETSHAAALTADEMALSVFDGEVIDVDEIVREQILLSVPDRALCDENCRGICSMCGTNLNAGSCDCKSSEGDPRWAALKNLKNGEA